MSTAAGTPAAVGEAFKQARDFNRAGISARAGLVAAIPVAVMMGIGIALGSAIDAVTMGVGAMLVGVAWRAGGGPSLPPLGTMGTATLALTLCTLAGTLSGRWPWLHLGVLVVVCVLAGLATSLGRRGITPGNQAIIAFVAFGRFPEDLANACGLAGLVLAGGAAQTLFAALVGRPAAWRRQRLALATAYTRLAALTATLDSSSAPTASALEAADSLLAAPALFADAERAVLADLVDEGRRIRLELAALSSAIIQAQREQPRLYPDARAQLLAALTRLRPVLEQVAAVVEGVQHSAAQLTSTAEELTAWGAGRDALPLEHVDERLGALVGQITAAARLATALDAPARLGRPTLGRRGLSARIAYRVRTDVRQIRARATLRAAPGRHALRLAVVVAGTELLTQRLALPRGYWAVLAAALILRPSFGATFTRGAERLLGTCLGVIVATLIAVAIDPGGWGVVAVVALLAYCTYAVYPASFAAGTAMMTAVIVFLLHPVVGDSVATALDRGLDTVIGGAIGLAAYALWPTWSVQSTGPLLADLVNAQHDYLELTLRGLIGGQPPDDAGLRACARRARVAFTDCEAAVTLARAEPRRGEADPKAATVTLGALRRVVYGVHALRLEAAAPTEPRPRPDLNALADAFLRALAAISVALRAGRTDQALPPLRRLYRKLEWAPADAALRPALDELVDAVNTAAASVGIELP